MSGIEEVGLVLGALPLVIQLVKAVKDSRDGVSFNELQLEFDTNLHLVREFISHMLESIEDLSEQDRIRLSGATQDSVKYWEDANLATELKEILGELTFSLIVRRMKEINRVLDRLKLKLGSDDAGLVRMSILDGVHQV